MYILCCLKIFHTRPNGWTITLTVSRRGYHIVSDKIGQHSQTCCNILYSTYCIVLFIAHPTSWTSCKTNAIFISVLPVNTDSKTVLVNMHCLNCSMSGNGICRRECFNSVWTRAQTYWHINSKSFVTMNHPSIRCMWNSCFFSITVA